MSLNQVKNVLTGASNGLKALIKSITGTKVFSKIGKGASSSLNNLGRYAGKVPLGGKVVGYMFKQSGKGIVIVATTSDNLINSAGNIVVDVLEKTKDLSVLTLNTAKGSLTRVNPFSRKRRRRRKSKRGGARRRKTKRKRRRKTKRKRKPKRKRRRKTRRKSKRRR